MAEEVVLMKGNEAIAHAAIRIGVDGYFGYPDRKSTRLNSSHSGQSRMPSSA